MSEENQVFRSDRDPQVSKLDTVVPGNRAAAPAAHAAEAEQAAKAAHFHDEPVPDAPVPTEPAPGTSPAVEPATEAAAVPDTPAPELKFEVDHSQLWHAPETLAQRIAKLQSTSAATAHLLDEQEAETRRIEQQLKSL